MTRTKRIILIISIIAILTAVLGIVIGLSYYRTSSLIKKYSAEYDVPESVVSAVIEVESNFNPWAKSSAGAVGLMQMMPSTFDWLTGEEHLNEHLTSNSLTDPDVSIRYGTYYLHYLYLKFGNWDTVLAAYNGGEGNVAKWLKDPEYSDGEGNLTYIPFEETRNYVKKVNDAMASYETSDSTK